MNDDQEKPFFVGYLDMPAPLRRFYWPLAILMLTGSLLVGYTVASAQKSTVSASWQTDRSEILEGIVTVDPYPVLHRMDPENPNRLQSVLLVKQGKFSAEDVTKPFHNAFVSVTGFPIRHGGWTMLELDGDGNIEARNGEGELAENLASQLTAKSYGLVTLPGELVDSKCYLGVMKPGEGPVHRACAEVCLLGGMPAMLVVRGPDRIRYGYILMDHEEASVSKAFSTRSADQITVEGELLQKGDLLYLKMSPPRLETAT